MVKRSEIKVLPLGIRFPSHSTRRQLFEYAVKLAESKYSSGKKVISDAYSRESVFVKNGEYHARLILSS